MWVIECFFMYFDMFMWVIVVLLLKRNLVRVLVSLVLLILVGFRNRNELMGWFGFFRFVCVWCIVLEIVISVFF